MKLIKVKYVLIILAAVAAELFVPAFGYSASAGADPGASVHASR